jgi:hypothetical protein
MGIFLPGTWGYEDDGGSTDEGGYPLKIGLVNYDTGNISEPTLSQVLEWEGDNADILIGGRDPTTYGGDADWTPYYATNFYWYYQRYKTAKEWAATNGFTFENMFLHMTQDYTSRHPWELMDRFGVYEAQSKTSAENGVICDSGGVLTDYSNRACGIYTSNLTFTDNLYVGHELPFDEMNFVLAAAGSSVTGEWQYWDGDSWETLSVTDGTSAFTSDGQITFTPPSDWARTSVNSSWSKYFVRYHITGGTAPTIDTLKGDDWLSSVGTYNCRGWDATDENIVNSGELAYNPTPPGTATARFRHQSRATGYWQTGLLFTNIAYEEGGVYAISKFLSEQIIGRDENATGVFLDSTGWDLSTGITDPTDDPEVNYTDFRDYAEGTWTAAWENSVTALVTYCQEVEPGYKVGGNTRYVRYLDLYDFAYWEYMNPPHLNGAIKYMDYDPEDVSLSYDCLLPANNPDGKFAVFMHQDVLDYITSEDGAYWDRSNRGPMAVLSSHYIASNDYSYLDYFSFGGWAYYDTDEIYTLESPGTTMTAAITADSSGAVKEIHVADASAFPSSGTRTLKIGDNVILPHSTNSDPGYTKVSDTLLTTTKPIRRDVSIGDTVRFLKQTPDRMSDYEGSGYPSYTDIWKYANFFPAMYVDIGVPDTNGWNSGQRGEWDTNVWRRDFENAIVLFRKGTSRAIAAIENDAQVYELGANYTPLRSDGTQGDPISEVTLRQAEGAILFPAGAGPSVSSAAVSTDGTEITITCSESVLPASGITGFTITGASNASVNTGTASGSTITLSLTGTIVQGEGITLSYSGGNVTDTGSPALQLIAFADLETTNNSTVSATPDTITIESSAVAINTSTSEDELVVDVPSGTAEGDLLLAVASCLASRSVWTPTGWTKLFEQVASIPKLTVFYKIADADDTSGTFTFEGSSTFLRGHICVMRITGHDGSLVYDTVQDGSYTNTVKCPDITVTDEGSYVLSIETCNPAGDSTLAGTTEIYDNDSSVVYQMGIYGESGISAGAFTGRTITLSASSYKAAATIAINPALRADTEIDAVVYSGEAGTGTKQISSGFPLPEGLVTEQDVIDGKIVVKVAGSEVAANVTALRGRHNDDTLRSVLIQFEYAVSEGATVNATVTVGGAVRSYEDPAYVLPTYAMVVNNNIIVPTDTTYLCSTAISFQRLLPEGSGSSSEEDFYTTFCEEYFDAVVAADAFGTASYNDPRGMVAMWCRTADRKYHTQAIANVLSDDWLPYNTPTRTPGNKYDSKNVANPDGRAGTGGQDGISAEWHSIRMLSYAAAYLLTGYRDFWGVVDVHVQNGLRLSKEDDVDLCIKSGLFPRYYFGTSYGHTIPAMLIDATMRADIAAFDGESKVWGDVLEWIIAGMLATEWDIRWIPFENGSGTRPSEGATVSQGAVSATILDIYGSNKDGPRIPIDGESGYIQVKDVTGGSFSAGALTISGCTADATGADEDDYRNGIYGIRSYGDRDTEIPIFQYAVVMNALIDIYLNIERDSRIPAMVKSILDIVLQNIAAYEAGDEDYGVSDETWGEPEYGHNYYMKNPIGTTKSSKYMPEYARAVAFVYRTEGNDTVNGADYLTWYERCIHPGNVNLTVMQYNILWKQWGQLWGNSIDTPWIMAQTDLASEAPASARVPIDYDDIMSSTPDVYRGQT